MQENLLAQKEDSVKNAEKYALKYFSDLQAHFSLSDDEVLKVVKNCVSKLKRKHPPNKWWQIF